MNDQRLQTTRSLRGAVGRSVFCWWCRNKFTVYRQLENQFRRNRERLCCIKKKTKHKNTHTDRQIETIANPCTFTNRLCDVRNTGQVLHSFLLLWQDQTNPQSQKIPVTVQVAIMSWSFVSRTKFYFFFLGNFVKLVN